MLKEKAILITDNLLHTDYAKTAHGLIRGSERFEVLGVIDAKNKGIDAGELLDGLNRNIPVMASVEEAIDHFKHIDTLVVGVATVGGVLSDSLLNQIKIGITNGIDIVNGLHDKLSEREDIVAIAKENKVKLTDIRKPKAIADLHFWTGEIFNIEAPIIAVLGMDCAMGKRTTARMIKEASQAAGLKAEMIYTGQTGWMQGGKYGFIFDSTLNDFVSGELEHAILECYKAEKPNLIILEGQSSLRNPSGPCGLEFLISGHAKQVVLIHSPHKTHFEEKPNWGQIPSVESEIEIIEKFGSKVIALALNTNGMSTKEAKACQNNYQKTLGIPVVLPIQEGVGEILDAIALKKRE